MLKGWNVASNTGFTAVNSENLLYASWILTHLADSIEFKEETFTYPAGMRLNTDY